MSTTISKPPRHDTIPDSERAARTPPGADLPRDLRPEPRQEAGTAASDLEARMRLGASWFFWVAALSLVNSIIAITGGGWAFAFGLGVTQVIDAIALGVASAAPEIAGVAKGIALVADVVVAGAFVLLGILARRRLRAAFLVGMVLYGADALVLLLFQDFFGLAFHAFVLFQLVVGFRALLELRREGDAQPSAATV